MEHSNIVGLFQVNGQTQAARLANFIIGGLKHRSLCETCREEEPVVTVNLYQLVRQSLSHYRIDDSDDDTRKLIRSHSLYHSSVYNISSV